MSPGDWKLRRTNFSGFAFIGVQQRINVYLLQAIWLEGSSQGDGTTIFAWRPPLSPSTHVRGSADVQDAARTACAAAGSGSSQRRMAVARMMTTSTIIVDVTMELR